MSATTLTTSTSPATGTASNRQLLRRGATAGVVAAAATTAVAAAADAIGVSLAVGGESIPLPGFAQMTLLAAVIGVALAAVMARRASRARHTFISTTLVLTGLTFVPDVLADAQTSTKLTLMLTHVVAAAIVIPALASRLSD
jgi:peptidoglycan/LPS O-acetylase OafA/YrhL